MSDRIIFSPDSLSAIAKNLSDLAQNLADVRSRIDGMQMTSENGGELDLLPGSVRLTHRRFSSGGTVAAHLKVLAGAMSAERDDILAVMEAVNQARTLFEEAEAAVNGLADSCLDSGSTAQQEKLDARMDAVDALLQQIMTDYAAFEGFINYEELEKITGLLSNIYSVMSGNGTDLLTVPAHEMAMSLLASISSGTDLSNGLLDAVNDGLGKFDDSKGFSKNLVDAITDGKMGDEFEEFLDDIPLVDGFNVGDLGALKDGGETAQKLINAYSDYTMMMNADPAKLQSLADGLRASDDPTMESAAVLLESMKDPAFCKAYCMASNGCSELLDMGSEALGDAIGKIPGIGGAAAVVEMGQQVSEGLTNASELVNCAHQVERMDSARQSAYQTTLDAISEYKSNPTDANYQKVVDAKNTYYSLTSQTVDSMKQLTEARNDSWMGQLNQQDTSGFDRLSQSYRYSRDNTAVDHAI